MKALGRLPRCLVVTLVTLLLISAVGLVLAGCAPSGTEAAAVLKGGSQAKPSSQATLDATATAASSNAFAFDLFGTIRPEERNFVCSPYAVSTVLSMAMAGAKGSTQREFRDVLHLDLPQESLYPALGALDVSLAKIEEFTSASSLWGQTGMAYEQEFVDVLGRTYGAPLRLVDFDNYATAAETINQWMAEATKGRIPRAVDPQGPRPDVIVLMLTTAAYMKAKWEEPFKPSLTRDLPFHLLDGAEVQTPTMCGLPEEYDYMEDSDLQAIEIPYDDGRPAFVIVLPAEGHFPEVGDGLNSERLDQILRAMETRNVTLYLPRFTFSSSADLKQPLKDLGLTTAFSKDADFSGMSGEQSEISGVGEEAFILVDEAGTEAAAGATITMSAGVSLDDVRLFVDRPFYFLIRDQETGLILFLGQVTDPRK
jgi:serpin B